MTRVYDVEVVREASRLWQAEANKIAKWGEDKWFVEYQIQKLMYFGEHGIPSCYESPEKMMEDFWPDFSDRFARLKKQTQMLFEDPRFEAIQKKIAHEERFDLFFEINKGINELEAKGPKPPPDKSAKTKSDVLSRFSDLERDIRLGKITSLEDAMYALQKILFEEAGGKEAGLEFKKVGFFKDWEAKQSKHS